MEKVYILGGLRTPIGITNGILKNKLPEELAAIVIKNLIRKFNLQHIDSVILGNAVGPGGNIARLSSLMAGLDVPSFTIDMQCASALKSIEVAYTEIACGLSEVIIAGGVESTSMSPVRYYSKNDPRKTKDNEFYKVAQFTPDDHSELSMIEGAERVAKKYAFSREDLDLLSIESHRKAFESKKYLEGIKTAVNTDKCENLNMNNTNLIIEEDEGIRKGINERLLKRLRPILNGGNMMTAGNSCLTHDGAAMVILCSERGIKKILNNVYIEAEKELKNDMLVKLDEIFQIKGFCNISGEGNLSPENGVKVVKKIMSNFNLTYDDIDAFEINEAFAVITALFQEEFGNMEKLNRFGGALAYGHPYGASGGIITLHLIEVLKHFNGRRGIVAIPAAGGLGEAMILERTNLKPLD
ncbi:TPA: thiolase family protein [Clostridium perfringens]